MTTTLTADLKNRIQNPAKEKTAEQRQNDFNSWMANKVKSKFYADNHRMTLAYQKIV